MPSRLKQATFSGGACSRLIVNYQIKWNLCRRVTREFWAHKRGARLRGFALFLLGVTYDSSSSTPTTIISNFRPPDMGR